MRLFLSFTRIAFHEAAIYKLNFWSGVAATFVMMYGMYSMWGTLYQQTPDAFGITLESMKSYGAIGMLLRATIGISHPARYYIAGQVRSGRLELDLMKPVNFITHMLALNGGKFAVGLLLRGVIGLLFAYFVLKIKAPATLARAFAFLISLFLGYIISFCFNAMVGLLAVITLDIRSYSWAVNALISFTAGNVVPLWLFPQTVATILSYLPFQAMYFAPLSIYVGAEQGSVTGVLLGQLAWAAAFLLLANRFWAYLQRHIAIQGG